MFGFLKREKPSAGEILADIAKPTSEADGVFIGLACSDAKPGNRVHSAALRPCRSDVDRGKTPRRFAPHAGQKHPTTGRYPLDRLT